MSLTPDIEKYRKICEKNRKIFIIFQRAIFTLPSGYTKEIWVLVGLKFINFVNNN